MGVIGGCILGLISRLRRSDMIFGMMGMIAGALMSQIDKYPMESRSGVLGAIAGAIVGIIFGAIFGAVLGLINRSDSETDVEDLLDIDV